jgi:hypothetical protein
MGQTVAALGALIMLAATAAGARAEPEPHVVALTLKDHRFTPESITVPADQRIRIDLLNQDGASEEFDSEDLHVERDVTPHGRVSFFVGPLKPGKYDFMGELHANTASGQIEAVEKP